MNRCRPTIAFAATVALTASVALAGTVQVVVTDDGGYPVEGVRLRLETGTGGSRISPPTSAEGIALFEDLKAGTYTVSVGEMPLSYFVDPADNHLDPAPSAILLDDDEAATMSVTLRRGIEVVSTLEVRGQEPPGSAWVVYVNPEHGIELRSTFGDFDETRKTLLPGLWEITLAVSPGYLLAGVSRDGVDLPGASVHLGPGETWRTTQVTWTVESHCRLHGSVVEEEGRSTTGMPIAAELVEPGEWIESARERGSDGFDRAVARVDQHGRYSMFVVSGTWRLRPVGDRLVSSRPEYEEVACLAGNDVSSDFLVTMEDGDEGRTLAVHVRDPHGNPIGGASVGVWDSDQEPSDPPVRTARTRNYGWAWIAGLPPGSYRVVAAHPDWTDRSEAVQGFGEAESSPPVRLTLGVGATVRAVAMDTEDGRVSDVVVEVRRKTSAIPPELEHLGLAEAKRFRQGSTDATGVVEMTGFYDGPHEVRGRPPGARGRTHFVRVRDEDRLLLDLDDGDLVDLEARVLEAGALAGHLVCDDGEPVPGAASFRVLPASWERSDSTDDLEEGAVVSIESEPLSGSVPDEFVLGPLEDDAFFVAVRPAGFDRWTWYSGTEDAEMGSLVQAAIGEVTPLFAIRLMCAPRVEIRPDPSDRSPLPDLREATVEARAFVPGADGESPVKGVHVEQDRERVIVHGLPAGEIRLEATIRHPMFLPDGVVGLDRSFESERGTVAEWEPELDGVGGVVEWRGEAAAVRLVRPEAGPRLETPVDGLTRLEAVPAGSYAMEICSDPACESVTRRIHPVVVEAGEVTRVAD